MKFLSSFIEVMNRCWVELIPFFGIVLYLAVCLYCPIGSELLLGKQNAPDDTFKVKW